MRAIDLLVQESNLSTLRKHKLVFASGASLDIYTTPVTLAERRMAGENAKSDDQLQINLQLLIAKAKDADGVQLFNAGDLGKLQRLVTAELVAELVNALYAREPMDDLEDVPAAQVGKSSSSSSVKPTA